jgi:gliding motility-associated-like protein
VSQTTAEGCEGDSAAINVVIVYVPEFNIVTRGWVCQFDSISLAYNGAHPLVNGSFLWTLPEGASYAGGTSSNDPSIIVKFDTVNPRAYVTLLVGNLNGKCSSIDTIPIEVVQIPTANATSKAEVCLSDTVSLALSSRSYGANLFTWLVDNTPLFSSSKLNVISANSNSGGPFTIQWLDIGKHFITVQATGDHGCTSLPTADTVDVHALPDASFTFTTHGGTLCLEDSVLFTASSSNYQNTYMWAPEHSFNNNGKHTIWGKVEQNQSFITLTVNDPFGCIATSTQELDPASCCTILFPNAFTPNGDGNNDLFRPVKFLPGYHRYHMFRVQNRWGQTVFESVDNKAEWDGNFNGVPQDMGVYYYYLKYDCGGKTLEEKGDLTLIR